MLAPNTLRTPISFVRCSATKDARPNKPRHEMKTANTAKKVERLPIRSSSENFLAYSSSVNLYSKGLSGFYLLKTVPILSNAAVLLTVGFIRTVIMLAQFGSIAKIVG